MGTCDRESAISTRIRGAWSHSDAAYIGFVMEQGVVKPPDDGILMPSLRVGAGSGAGGLLFGGVVGTIRSAHPVLWATVTGIQWSLLGGTYWGFRSALLKMRIKDEVDEQTKSYVSAAAGGLSAALVGGVTRGRANIIPGTIMGSLVGLLGQKGYSIMDRKHSDSLAVAAVPDVEKWEPFWRKAMQSKYSPVKHLSHEEYKKVLEDKLLRVDAEIAVIDDDIAAVKREEASSRSNDKDSA